MGVVEISKEGTMKVYYGSSESNPPLYTKEQIKSLCVGIAVMLIIVGLIIK